MRVPRPTAARHASWLAIGSAASGLLAYVFFVVVTRSLGATDAAPVSVLWTYWSFAGAALIFPIQHWIARSVTSHRGEGAVRQALPGVVLIAVLLSVVTFVVSWLVRDPLFGDEGIVFPALVGVVTLASAAMGLVRGVLSARQRFEAVAAGLFGENALRCVAAIALALLGVSEPAAYGVALLSGYLVVLQPSAYRLGRTGDGATESAAGFLGGAAGGQLLGQAVLTGGPVVLALIGGRPAQVTALFAALALCRAPYTLANGVLAQFTGYVTGLVVDRRTAALGMIRRRAVLATAGVGVLAVVLGALLGPAVLRLIFGPGTELEPSQVALVALGGTFALTNLVLTVTVLAHGLTRHLVAAWSAGLVAGLIAFVLPGGTDLTVTCLAFAIVEVVALVVLLVFAARAAKTLEEGPSAAV